METQRVHSTVFHMPNTVTGSTSRSRPSDMAETHGLMMLLLIFLEKLLVTNSKGIVTV